MGDVSKEEPELREYRFTRVVFGVSSSPFLLKATVKYHLGEVSGHKRGSSEALLSIHLC